MKRILFTAPLVLAAGLAAQAATTPAYELLSPIVSPPQTAPQIDASNVTVRSVLVVDTTGGTSLPYRTANTRNFTNTSSGLMIGTPGFLFNLSTTGSTTNGNNFYMPSFNNQGSIASSDYLDIQASNLYSPGRLTGSERAQMSLEGTNVWLGRAVIKGGDAAEFAIFTNGLNVFSNVVNLSTNGGGTNSGQFTYVQDVGVADRYWGTGVNNQSATNTGVIDLTALSALFSLPFPSSFSHEVSAPRTVTPFRVLVGASNGCGSGYAAYVHTNLISANSTNTNVLIQVVFVATNSQLSTNIFTDVRFVPVVTNNSLLYVPIVEFKSIAWDSVDFQQVPHSAYLLDWAAVQGAYALNSPPAPLRTHRPLNFELTRNPALGAQLPGFDAANGTLTPDLFYSRYHTSNTVNLLYAGYSAQIGQTNSQYISQFGNTRPAFSDPSNFVGQVQVTADNLFLDQSRLRAENFLGLRATNLINNLFAHVDAPFVNLDIGTTSDQIVMDQVLPPTVDRLSGQISAYSCLWNIGVNQLRLGPQNTLATNLVNVTYQVLIVDNCLSGQQEVVLNKLAIHSPNLSVKDSLIVNNSVWLDVQNLNLEPGARIVYPTNWSWVVTNAGRYTPASTNASFAALGNLTNSGEIRIPAAAYFGTDTPNPSTNAPPLAYTNFINHGFITAAATFVRAQYFENTSIFQNNPNLPVPEIATIQSLQGIMALDFLQGQVNNASLIANGDLSINAGSLAIANTTNYAGTTNNQFIPVPGVRGSYIPGAMILSVTNELTDGFTQWDLINGPDLHGYVVNQWETTGGFQLNLPAQGSLLGTRIISRANKSVAVNHTWAGRDFGATPDGYNLTNLPLGWLTLDSPGPFSKPAIFNFNSPNGASNALYVDFLELRNDMLTNYQTALKVGPNMMIYFADANVPPSKLDGKAGGRLRWVRNYAGPHSYTNLLYPNGVTYTFNSGLVRNSDLDCNGNGVVNHDDPFPIDVGLLVSPRVSVVSGATNQVVLEWDAPATVVDPVRYVVTGTTNIASPTWGPLTNLSFAPGVAPLRWTNAAPTGAVMLYRVLVDECSP